MPPDLKLHDPTDWTPDPRRLAAEELIRPAGPAEPPRASERDLAPFSRAWYEELEHKRHAGTGAWLRRALEVSRHPHDTMLMLGAGAGSDAAQYHRHGTDVTVCVTPLDPPDLARRGFAARGLAVPVVAAPSHARLPFAPDRFDLVYVNLIHNPPPDLDAAAAEVYRVLKPGGKAFVLAPARYDADFWARAVLPVRRLFRPAPALSDAPKHSAHSLRAAFGQFTEPKACKRHLRRADLPPAWRFAPTWLAERVVGRVVVLKAFKPVSAAYAQAPADAA